MYYILFPPFPNLRGWGNVRYSFQGEVERCARKKVIGNVVTAHLPRLIPGSVSSDMRVVYYTLYI